MAMTQQFVVCLCARGGRQGVSGLCLSANLSSVEGYGVNGATYKVCRKTDREHVDSSSTKRRQRLHTLAPSWLLCTAIWRLCQRVRVQKALVDSIVVEFEEHANVESNDDGSTEAGHSEATAGEASLAEEDHIRHEALGREAETLAAQF
eukprot:3609444-Prymnesium_polylepis.1